MRTSILNFIPSALKGNASLLTNWLPNCAVMPTWPVYSGGFPKKMLAEILWRKVGWIGGFLIIALVKRFRRWRNSIGLSVNFIQVFHKNRTGFWVVRYEKSSTVIDSLWWWYWGLQTCHFQIRWVLAMRRIWTSAITGRANSFRSCKRFRKLTVLFHYTLPGSFFFSLSLN